MSETFERAAPILIITLDQLRAIYFDPKAEKDSDVMQRMPRSGCGYAKSLMPKGDSAPRSEVFVAWMASPGAISRAAEHLSSRHSVRLVWRDGDIEKELVLTVNHCEYASFVANLRRLAGQRGSTSDTSPDELSLAQANWVAWERVWAKQFVL